jgi:hypothetical protein
LQGLFQSFIQFSHDFPTLLIPLNLAGNPWRLGLFRLLYIGGGPSGPCVRLFSKMAAVLPLRPLVAFKGGPYWPSRRRLPLQWVDPVGASAWSFGICWTRECCPLRPVSVASTLCDGISSVPFIRLIEAVPFERYLSWAPCAGLRPGRVRWPWVLRLFGPLSRPGPPASPHCHAGAGMPPGWALGSLPALFSCRPGGMLRGVDDKFSRWK